MLYSPSNLISSRLALNPTRVFGIYIVVEELFPRAYVFETDGGIGTLVEETIGKEYDILTLDWESPFPNYQYPYLLEDWLNGRIVLVPSAERYVVVYSSAPVLQRKRHQPGKLEVYSPLQLPESEGALVSVYAQKLGSYPTANILMERVDDFAVFNYSYRLALDATALEGSKVMAEQIWQWDQYRTVIWHLENFPYAEDLKRWYREQLKSPYLENGSFSQ